MELKQKPSISRSAIVAKKFVPQNPQCLILKEQIDVQNNKRTEIGKELKIIKGGSDSGACDDKVSSDQISCINEHIKLRQNITKEYDQQITDIGAVVKGLQSDYKNITAINKQ